MSLLENISSPADIRGFSNRELQTLCQEIRDYMIDCCSDNPGHIGSSLGAVEIAVAVHKVFNTPEDHLVWDVGHQAYAHKILTGRREAFRNNRKLGGLSGFPKRSESEYDAFGTGHSSTSVSAAFGLATADRLKGLKRKTIAVIGDGAMSGGLAFEGLNNAGSFKNTDLIVILNDNQIAIDRNIGALHNYLVRFTTSHGYNKLKKRVWNHIGENRTRSRIQRMVQGLKSTLVRGKDINLFSALGFRYFGPIDGNNIIQLTDTLERLSHIHGPILLHAITTKGKGYAPAEANQTVWHAPGKFNPETGERTGKKSQIAKYQEVFGTTLLEMARQDSRIVGVTPAMASGCSMDIMMREMPERVFDVGIAEGHAVTFSAGLAAEGMLPFCNIYSSFSQRAYDNLIHDVALQNLKVILCLDRAGIVGEDGATHHGAFDLACFRAVPNVTIAAPMNELELRNLMHSAAGEMYPGATIIRYPRGCGAGVQWRDAAFEQIERGTARKLFDGIKDSASRNDSVAVLSIGHIGNKAAQAVEMAATNGISVLHYDVRFLKPVDTEALADACARASRIITVEDASTIGGLFDVVSEYVASHGCDCQVSALGMPDSFVEQGTPEELFSLCGYNTEDIFNTIIFRGCRP